jgi:hypothetical protein
VLRILYVEDNEDNAYMLKTRLELTDEFEVLVAEDGEKGCEIAAAKRPDLILMDLEMPVVDGWEATRRASPRRATCLSSACRPMRLPASARRRSRPDVRSSIPSRWSLIGCWAKFASWLADGWRKLREAQRAWDLTLTDTGFIEGETVATEYRLAENQIGWLSALAAPQG